MSGHRKYHGRPCRISRQTHFSFWGSHMPCPLAWPCNTRLFPLGLHQKQGIWNTFFQYWWPTTANSGVRAREPYGNASCYDRLSIVTAGVYWTTSCSTTKCHIKTERNQMNSHRHGTYLLVSIKCFSCYLKTLFHFSKWGVVEALYFTDSTDCIPSKTISPDELSSYQKHEQSLSTLWLYVMLQAWV